MLLVIPIMLGGVRIETGLSHAIGLSALVAGIIFNPLTWLVIVIAFVAATLLTGKTSKRTST